MLLDRPQSSLLQNLTFLLSIASLLLLSACATAPAPETPEILEEALPETTEVPVRVDDSRG